MYKKKNGTKSNLVKMYLERIVADPVGILDAKGTSEDVEICCPMCSTKFGRITTIHGREAIKIIGNRAIM